MLDFLLKTKNQSTRKTTEVPNANNSNENRNKTRRDHDITMAGTFNDKLPAKLTGWSDTGDGVPIGNQMIIFELLFVRKIESERSTSDNDNEKKDKFR